VSDKCSVWLHFRSSLSFRDVEEMLVARGTVVGNEPIRCWTIKFGFLIAGSAASGRLSMMKARNWTFWSSDGGTQGPLKGCLRV